MRYIREGHRLLVTVGNLDPYDEAGRDFSVRLAFDEGFFDYNVYRRGSEFVRRREFHDVVFCVCTWKWGVFVAIRGGESDE